MTEEETNKYFDIYENYVEDLIRLDGNNPICYVCSTRTIQDQMDNYVIGSLWPRMPSLDNDPDWVIYAKIGIDYYPINVFNPKLEGKVMIISYKRGTFLDAV